jgi:ribosomal protein S18 acetylase RimI-like enzyme
MTDPALTILPVRSADDLASVVALFRAYATSLDVNLGYQKFEAEMAGMPCKYAPPRGEIFLARRTAGPGLGCVALRPLDEPGVCEMKRLYVAPAGRGLGLGAALVDAVVAHARAVGYRDMRLDSLPSMSDAIALYRRRGFTDMAPYYVTPVAGTVFLRKELRS